MIGESSISLSKLQNCGHFAAFYVYGGLLHEAEGAIEGSCAFIFHIVGEPAILRLAAGEGADEVQGELHGFSAVALALIPSVYHKSPDHIGVSHVFLVSRGDLPVRERIIGDHKEAYRLISVKNSERKDGAILDYLKICVDKAILIVCYKVLLLLFGAELGYSVKIIVVYSL